MDYMQKILRDEENMRLSTHEAAVYLNYSHWTLVEWRVSGKGPKWFKPARKVFYYKKDLDEWLRSNPSSH